MGIGRILLSPQHFFHTPNLLQLPLNHPPCYPPTHAHLHTSPQGCFVHHWNVHVELCVRPPPNLHHAHRAKSQSPCICTLAPRGPLLFGWCTHYVPTTSHQPPATFRTAPTPPHTLRARLHCHIWMCLSIHVSLCLEEFSPQTSPSGTNYPMVGVLSMCPPHQFSQFPTSGHPCGPARTRFFAYLALHGLCTTLCTLLHTSVHLCAPPHTSAHLCTPFRTPLCTSAHLRASPHTSVHLRTPPHTPAQLLHFTFQG